MNKIKQIAFFGNGTTFVEDENGEQISELQENWVRLYIDFLVSKGIDPEGVELNFAHGVWKVIKTSDGYNWKGT